MHQETLELNCSGTSLALDSTLVVVVEMSLSAWLVCAEVPGLERRATKKMSVDEAELLSWLHRWRDEDEKRLDCKVSRICVAYEAGRDGFWLAHFLRGSGIEAHVMHSKSIPVNRDHCRAKTDLIDCHLMIRAFLGRLMSCHRTLPCFHVKRSSIISAWLNPRSGSHPWLWRVRQLPNESRTHCERCQAGRNVSGHVTIRIRLPYFQCNYSFMDTPVSSGFR